MTAGQLHLYMMDLAPVNIRPQTYSSLVWLFDCLIGIFLNVFLSLNQRTHKKKVHMHMLLIKAYDVEFVDNVVNPLTLIAGSQQNSHSISQKSFSIAILFY